MKLPSFARAVDFVKCEGNDHLKEFTEQILSVGGGGVMLREPGSVYKPGKSTSLRKYKPVATAQVQVVKSQYPYGFSCKQYIRFILTVAYFCRENGNILFVKIPQSLTEQAKNVEINSTITVKHRGVNTYGNLLFPFYANKSL